jgi:hypothetical protein
MKPTLILKSLVSIYTASMATTGKAPRSVSLVGAPGGGKTTLWKEVAAHLGIPIIVKHMPTMLVEDFGVPRFSADSATFDYALPDWWPLEDVAPPKGILLFDDRNQCGPDIQKVNANIEQERTLHGHKLPDGWWVVSTGNRKEDRAGSGQVLTHLQDRETTINYDTDLSDWTGWALDHNVRPEVITFIKFRPNLLHDFDPKEDKSSTPRGWVEGVSDSMGIIPPEAEYEWFSGAVGQGAASEFTGYLRIWRKLPDPIGTLEHPTTTPVPDDMATLYALSGALAAHVTHKTFGNLVKYIDRMPPEFSVLTMSYLIRKDKTFAEQPEFAPWSVRHQDLMF